MEITATETWNDVLALFKKKGHEFDNANITTCVSTAARRCKQDLELQRKCQADPRWTELLESVSSCVRMLTARELTAVSWGLATLSVQQPLLMKRIAWQVCQKAQDFEHRTLANTLWAFATLGVRELELPLAGMALYPRLAEEVIRQIDSFRPPQELANVLWAFATLTIRNEELFEIAAKALVAMIDELNAFDLGQTIWAFAAVRVRVEQLFFVIAERIKALQDEHRPINIANLSWGYAKVEYRDEALFQCLAMLARQLLPRLNPQDMCNTIWALATMRVQDQQLCAGIGSRTIQMIKSSNRGQFTLQEVATMLWAFAKLDYAHKELFDVGFDALNTTETLHTVDPKETSMFLWSLQHFEMHDHIWAFFQGFVKTGVNPGITAYSHLLCWAQRRHDLEAEVQVWKTMVKYADSGSLLAKAFVNAASISCRRRGRDPRAMALLDDLQAEEISSTKPLHLQSKAAPYSETYAKELEVLAAVSEGGAGAETVRASIEGWVVHQQKWLKLAADEKGLVLDRIVDERRPKLLVEVGFYVGYSSTRMASRMRKWGGRLISIEVDPVHAAIGQNSVMLAGLSDVIEVWCGHSSEVLPRLLTEFGQHSVDVAFFDQKGTHYHIDLATLVNLRLLADGCVVMADNVIKPGAPHFLWRLHHHPAWDLQVISVREYSSEAIEDWMSVSTLALEHLDGNDENVPDPPRSYDVLAFQTDVIRWQATNMNDRLNVSDWARFSKHVRMEFERCGIRGTAIVENGDVRGLLCIRPAV